MLAEKNRFAALLRDKNLKVTQPRLHVMDVISSKRTAVSQPDLEKQLGKEFDRVTLYRTLTAFEEKGILHKILDLNGTASYALCSSNCSEQKHHDRHVHFICSSCNDIFCLEAVNWPQIGVPKGFTINSMEMNAIGLCDRCHH